MGRHALLLYESSPVRSLARRRITLLGSGAAHGAHTTSVAACRQERAHQLGVLSKSIPDRQRVSGPFLVSCKASLSGTNHRPMNLHRAALLSAQAAAHT